MNIEIVNPSSSLRVYYKARNLTSDLDVVFNIWDDTGAIFVSNASAQEEVGDRGVYYLDITTPSTSTYLLVKSSLASGDDIASSVYAVGAPSKKAFYVHATYRTGLQLPYEVFDINAVREDTGNFLTEVAGGFYYADVNDIDSQESLFFKVGYLAFEFDLRDLVVIDGGILVAGGATTFIVAVTEPQIASGVILGGLVLPAYHEVGLGGAVLDGVAFVEHVTIRGGVVVSGAAKVIDQVLVRGGAVINGSAIIGIGEVVEGGILANGSVVDRHIRNITTEGGTIANGESAVFAIYTPLFDSDEPSIERLPGGLAAGGTFGGRFLFNEGSGGALVNGGHILGTSEVSSGGIVVGGSTEEFFTFWNYLRDREYLFSVGEIVYIQDPRKNQPSRYHRHTVEGFRFFGDHNLYDIGIGILVDEEFLVSDLNHDVIVSDEAVDTTDYINYIQDKLDSADVDPNPVGGSLGSEETEGEECCIPDYADLATIRFMKKLEDLSSTTVLPSPSGGIIVYSQQDGSDEVETSSITQKLESLDNMAVLPGPTGAYIVVSTETEPVPV